MMVSRREMLTGIIVIAIPRASGYDFTEEATT
jgi:hypothetical protein